MKLFTPILPFPEYQLIRALLLFCILFSPVVSSSGQAQTNQHPANTDRPHRIEKDQNTPIKINESIYMARGFGNTYMVITDEGNVIIDTSTKSFAPSHKKILQKINAGPKRNVVGEGYLIVNEDVNSLIMRFLWG